MDGKALNRLQKLAGSAETLGFDDLHDFCDGVEKLIDDYFWERAQGRLRQTELRELQARIYFCPPDQIALITATLLSGAIAQQTPEGVRGAIRHARAIIRASKEMP